MRLKRIWRVFLNKCQRILVRPVNWLDKIFPVYEWNYGGKNSYYPRPRGLFYGWASVLQEEQAIARSPRLVIRARVWRELFFYFLETPMETQLMGFISKSEDNLFILEDLVLTPHHGSLGEADLDQDAYPKWLEALEKIGKDITKMRVQIHSHGDMPPYFSEEDMLTIREDYLLDWMISIVGNRKGELLGRLDIFKPIPLSLSLPIFIEPLAVQPTNEEIITWKSKLKWAEKF